VIDVCELRPDESGQGMVEYGLIIGLMTVLVIAVFLLLGGHINTLFLGAVGTATMGTNQAVLSGSLY